MEIRRSVMGRPNLSERSTRLAVGSWLKCVSATRSFSGKKKAGGRPSAFPFQWLLTKPGGAGVSTRTLGTVFPPQNLEPQSCQGCEEKPSRAVRPRVYPEVRTVGNSQTL